MPFVRIQMTTNQLAQFRFSIYVSPTRVLPHHHVHCPRECVCVSVCARALSRHLAGGLLWRHSIAIGWFNTTRQVLVLGTTSCKCNQPTNHNGLQCRFILQFRHKKPLHPPHQHEIVCVQVLHIYIRIYIYIY